MGRVLIREYNDMARPRAGGSNVGTDVIKGTLVTDEMGLSIKSVDTIPGTAVDSAPMTRKTHFIVIEAVDSIVRYRIRPKRAPWTVAPATNDHPFVPFGGQVVEAVYPGAVISFLQDSTIGGDLIPFESAHYVPVLAL